MEYLDDYYPEVLDRGQARFYGQDPRYDGYLMARINIRLHMLGRLIRRQTARPASGGANADLSTPNLQVVVPSSEGLVPSREPASPLPRKEPPDGLGPLFSVIIPADSQKKNPPGQLALPGFSVEETPSLIASERDSST